MVGSSQPAPINQASMKKWTTAFYAASLGICGLLVGCDSSSGVSLDQQRESLVLNEEPAGALTPTEVKDESVDGDVSGASQVVLAGRIHAGDIDPFQAGQAAFMLTQLPDEGHGADDPDHADNCPFCKRRLEKAPKAIVQFKDAKGDVIKVDAKELFNVAKGDSVVVRGMATYQETTNTLSVDATALFKR